MILGVINHAATFRRSSARQHRTVLPGRRSGQLYRRGPVAGVTPAAVSRSVSRMEERLGVRLFARTTRSVKLTDSGRRYFEECRLALAQLVEAQREVMGQQQEPSGTLRISIPTTYAHHRILPLLPAFRARFPAVKVEVHISNRNIDFVGEGYDMAIRVRAIPDSGLILTATGRRRAGDDRQP